MSDPTKHKEAFRAKAMRRLSRAVQMPFKGPEIEVQDDHGEVQMYHKEELVEMHKELSQHLNRAHTDTETTRDILQTLSDSYKEIPVVCSCCASSDLACMIEESLQAYDRKVAGKPADETAHNEKTQLVGLMSRLKEQARRYSATEHHTMEKAKYYHDVSLTDLWKDIKRMEPTKEQVDLQFFREKTKIDQLRDGLVQTRHSCFLSRHSTYRKLIDAATVDCLTD